MTTTTGPAPGLHGSFAWSCAIGCKPDVDPDSSCGAVVFVAGTSAEGSHAYGWCVEDILLNPEMYQDDHLVLHGTHQLDQEQLLEIYGEDLGVPEHAAAYAENIRSYRNGHNDDSPYLAVAVDDIGDSFLVSAEILLDIIRNPSAYADRDYAWYGTHILTQEVLDEHFEEDER